VAFVYLDRERGVFCGEEELAKVVASPLPRGCSRGSFATAMFVAAVCAPVHACRASRVWLALA